MSPRWPCKQRMEPSLEMASRMRLGHLLMADEPISEGASGYWSSRSTAHRRSVGSGDVDLPHDHPPELRRGGPVAQLSARHPGGDGDADLGGLGEGAQRHPRGPVAGAFHGALVDVVVGPVGLAHQKFHGVHRPSGTEVDSDVVAGLRRAGAPEVGVEVVVGHPPRGVVPVRILVVRHGGHRDRLRPVRVEGPAAGGTVLPQQPQVVQRRGPVALLPDEQLQPPRPVQAQGGPGHVGRAAVAAADRAGVLPRRPGPRGVELAGVPQLGARRVSVPVGLRQDDEDLQLTVRGGRHVHARRRSLRGNLGGEVFPATPGSGRPALLDVAASDIVEAEEGEPPVGLPGHLPRVVVALRTQAGPGVPAASRVLRDVHEYRVVVAGLPAGLEHLEPTVGVTRDLDRPVEPDDEVGRDHDRSRPGAVGRQLGHVHHARGPGPGPVQGGGDGQHVQPVSAVQGGCRCEGRGQAGGEAAAPAPPSTVRPVLPDHVQGAVAEHGRHHKPPVGFVGDRGLGEVDEITAQVVPAAPAPAHELPAVQNMATVAAEELHPAVGVVPDGRRVATVALREMLPAGQVVGARRRHGERDDDGCEYRAAEQAPDWEWAHGRSFTAKKRCRNRRSPRSLSMRRYPGCRHPPAGRSLPGPPASTSSEGGGPMPTPLGPCPVSCGRRHPRRSREARERIVAATKLTVSITTPAALSTNLAVASLSRARAASTCSSVHTPRGGCTGVAAGSATATSEPTGSAVAASAAATGSSPVAGTSPVAPASTTSGTDSSNTGVTSLSSTAPVASSASVKGAVPPATAAAAAVSAGVSVAVSSVTPATPSSAPVGPASPAGAPATPPSSSSVGASVVSGRIGSLNPPAAAPSSYASPTPSVTSPAGVPVVSDATARVSSRSPSSGASTGDSSIPPRGSAGGESVATLARSSAVVAAGSSDAPTASSTVVPAEGFASVADPPSATAASSAGGSSVVASSAGMSSTAGSAAGLGTSLGATAAGTSSAAGSSPEGAVTGTVTASPPRAGASVSTTVGDGCAGTPAASAPGGAPRTWSSGSRLFGSCMFPPSARSSAHKPSCAHGRGQTPGGARPSRHTGQSGGGADDAAPCRPPVGGTASTVRRDSRWRAGVSVRPDDAAGMSVRRKENVPPDYRQHTPWRQVFYPAEGRDHRPTVPACVRKPGQRRKSAERCSRASLASPHGGCSSVEVGDDPGPSRPVSRFGGLGRRAEHPAAQDGRTPVS